MTTESYTKPFELTLLCAAADLWKAFQLQADSQDKADYSFSKLYDISYNQ